MNGTFLEQPSDPHVRLRSVLLDSGVVLPGPNLDATNLQVADFPQCVHQHLFPVLRKTGLGVVRFDELLSDEQLITLGSLLGEPMPELAPEVQPYVTKEVILNLVSELGRTAEPSLQPFATTFLCLHSERSGQPVPEQARYIILMCCDPGDAGMAAQTVLVPMSSVYLGLTGNEIALLAQTRFRRNEKGPFLLRNVEGRHVFSFRDFRTDRLDWVFAGGDGEPASAINAAILSLLASMYSGRDAFSVQWTERLLVVMDNTFYFHGRTAAQGETGKRPRHLKRLRVTSLEAEHEGV